jgi:predicted 3-demethylubiquinone-9 3-methyltransferase (glyoxalase superfamily)
MRIMMEKIKIASCPWFNKNAEEAAKFYAATFASEPPWISARRR